MAPQLNLWPLGYHRFKQSVDALPPKTGNCRGSVSAVFGARKMDWRTITDDREKYQAYLCSREWWEKRQAVAKRADGRCERCCFLPLDAVHHLTYARKYNERLEDLQAICNPCHQYTHGRIAADPSELWSWINYLLYCKSLNLHPVPFAVAKHGQHTHPLEIPCVDSRLQRRMALIWDLRKHGPSERSRYLDCVLEVCDTVNCRLPFDYDCWLGLFPGNPSSSEEYEASLKIVF